MSLLTACLTPAEDPSVAVGRKVVADGFNGGDVALAGVVTPPPQCIQDGYRLCARTVADERYRLVSLVRIGNWQQRSSEFAAAADDDNVLHTPVDLQF